MPLTLEDFDFHRFNYSDIILDTFDSTDHREYTLPLVYYKAISDGHEQDLDDYGDNSAR